MSYPAFTESGGASASTQNHTLTLPAYGEGDLIIVAFHTSGSGTHTWTFDSSTSKFTALFDQLAGSSQGRTVCKYRIMQAGDTGSSIAVASQFTTSGGYTIYHFASGSWHGTTVPEAATAVQVNNTNTTDPPSITPSWGSAQNLFVVISGRGSSSVSSGSTGYTLTTNRQSGGGAGVRAEYKEATASSDDPDTITFAANVYGATNTLVIRPTAATSASAPAASGTGTAGEASVTTWNSPSAGLAEGSGVAGAPSVTFGAFAPAGVASGTGTAETGTPAGASFPTPAVGGGIAGDVTALTSSPVNVYPDAATGTATAGQPAGGAEAFAGYAMGFGSGHLAAAGGGTVPAPRGAPLVITVGGTDVSAMTLTGFTFDATLGSVPTASITVADVTEALTWPPDTLAELVIGTAETTWFSGPVTSWQRRALFPGWEYTLRAEGWQRNLALSPVYPTTDVTSSYDGPAGTFVSPYPGHYIGMGDGTPVTDVDVIEGVLNGWWTGPALTYDVPYRVSVSWTIRPRGAPLSSVLDDIAARLGYHDVYWIDGAKVYHQRPGYRGGVAAGALRAPVEHVAPFFLAADTSGGGIVPVTLTDAGDGANVREGVHVIGKVPGANALYVPGPAYGGRDVTSAPESEDIYLSTLLARAYMGGRTEPRRTLSATLPAYSPVPPLGTLLGVEYDPVDPVRRYYLVRAVRAVLAVPGEGIGGIEWSVELGDADRRSYVYEAQEAVEDAPSAPPVQIVALEVGPVSDMALGSEQYVYCWPEDENGNKVALGSGRVEWTIWRTSVDVGVGDASIGWWFTGDNPPGITDIVWTEDQPLGFAYITLHCDTPADPARDAIVVTARLLVP